MAARFTTGPAELETFLIMLEKTAGPTYVTQATSFQGGSDGVYREARHAEMRQVVRVEWSDLQRLLEGEAIVLFGGRRTYARLFLCQSQ